jgi:hypothetical protein
MIRYGRSFSGFRIPPDLMTPSRVTIKHEALSFQAFGYLVVAESGKPSH